MIYGEYKYFYAHVRLQKYTINKISNPKYESYNTKKIKYIFSLSD